MHDHDCLDLTSLSSEDRRVLLRLAESLGVRVNHLGGIEKPTEPWSVVVGCLPQDSNEVLRESRTWVRTDMGRWVCQFTEDCLGFASDDELVATEILRVGLHA